MPILKRVVNIHVGENGELEVTDSYGRHVNSFPVDPDMSIQEFLFQRLRLIPGDRVYIQDQEVNILDDQNPTARVGRPRPAQSDRPRTGRPKSGSQE